MNPYQDSSNIRSFSKNVKKLELVWHKDDEDRDIETTMQLHFRNLKKK